MQNMALSRESLAGRWVVLNSFGIVRVRAVTDGGLAVEDGTGTQTIPLAVIRSIRLLAADGLPGPEVELVSAGLAGQPCTTRPCPGRMGSAPAEGAGHGRGGSGSHGRIDGGRHP